MASSMIRCLVGRQKPEVRITVFPPKQICLGAVVSRNGRSGMPCGRPRFLARRHIVKRRQERVAFSSTGDDFAKLGNAAHHVALRGVRMREHGVKRGDDRHFRRDSSR